MEIKSMKTEIIVGVIVGAILSSVGGYLTVYKDIVDIKSKVENTSLAEELKVHTGIIVPFYGSSSDAELLAKDGWIICDGRSIVDEKASPVLKGKATPNLVGQFLMGGKKSGDFGGNSVSETSNNGHHKHGKEQVRGSGFGDDNLDNQFLTSGAGGHSHKVNVVPPYMSVIYLIYVR